jgi:hypothetical protein
LQESIEAADISLAAVAATRSSAVPHCGSATAGAALLTCTLGGVDNNNNNQSL